MKECIYKVPVGGHYANYEVNLNTLQDRVRDCEGGWTNWRDITEDGFDFYRTVEPEMFVKRNNLIHENEF